MGRSKLQILAQKRNSAKGRIKGLRNNIRGMLNSNPKYLNEEEQEILHYAEIQFDEILQHWDSEWEQIKSNL